MPGTLTIKIRRLSTHSGIAGLFGCDKLETYGMIPQDVPF